MNKLGEGGKEEQTSSELKLRMESALVTLATVLTTSKELLGCYSRHVNV